MTTNFSIEEVKFYQNQDKRKTTAVIDNCAFDAYIDFMSEGNPTFDILTIDVMTIPEQIMMPDVIKATSTCHTGDNWDPEVGKKQAFFKLLRSYNKMKLRAIRRMLSYNANQNVLLSRLDNKYSNNINHYTKLVRYPKEK